MLILSDMLLFSLPRFLDSVPLRIYFRLLVIEQVCELQIVVRNIIFPVTDKRLG
jgi:hypothetical protein